MKLPIFEFIIGDNEEDGVTAISIVDDPAFQSSLVAFGVGKPNFVMLADAKGKKRKRICAGLSLIPNVLIYRRDPTIGEYFGYFSAATIEKIVEKYHENMNSNKVNLNHDPDKYIDAFMVSDYIVDSEEKVADLKRMGIEHENIMGAWYTAFKVKDEKVFEQILQGTAKTGFSVEAMLDTYLVQAHNQIIDNKIKTEMKKSNKSILDKIIDLFKKEMLERALVPELGFEIEWTEIGAPVQQVTVDEEGNETLTPVGPGEFKTDTSVIVVDDASNLIEVRELPEEPIEEPAVEPEMESDIQSEDNLKLPDEDLADYPWDQCIADQQAAGYTEEQANKICGYIKKKNASKESLTKELIEQILADECEGCKENLQEAPIPELPVEEPEAPVVDVKSKTVGELVGENDGEYWIKVVVESGQVTEAEVSSETDLLKQKLQKLENENKDLTEKNKTLEEKMKEPINEPVLQPPVEKKDWNKMSAYERALYQSKQRY